VEQASADTHRRWFLRRLSGYGQGDGARLEALREKVARGLCFPHAQKAWAAIAALDLADIAKRLLADSHEGEMARDEIPRAIKLAFTPEGHERARELRTQMESDGLVVYGWGSHPGIIRKWHKGFLIVRILEQSSAVRNLSMLGRAE